MSNNNNKMKGLLKGLRYISQIFDEKEPEMQIGLPTDVKHVAHIGWDGPSVNSASWMNDFSAPQECASAPFNKNGETKDDSTIKWVSQDSSCTASKLSISAASAPSSPARSFAGVPRSNRRQISKGEAGDSPRKKSDKPRQTRRSAKNANKDLSQGSKSSSNMPDKPKKSRGRKSKDGSVGNSRSRSKASASDMDTASESGSIKSLKGEKCIDVDDASETGSVSKSPRSVSGCLDEDDE